MVGFEKLMERSAGEREQRWAVGVRKWGSEGKRKRRRKM